MRIKIQAGNNRLEATLSFEEFETSKWREKFPTKNTLVSHLVSLNLDPELIEESAVERIFSILSEEKKDENQRHLKIKEAESLQIAFGIPPLDEEAEGLVFHKAYFVEGEDLKAIQEKLETMVFEELKSEIKTEYLVEPGQVILSFMSIRSGEVGKDVFGKSIPFKSYTSQLPLTGNGISIVPKKWVATEAGILALQANTLKIFRGIGEDCCSIQVSHDSMKVWLILKDKLIQHLEDIPRNIESVKKKLLQMGLGQLKEIGPLRSALETFFKTQKEMKILLIQGLAPRKGKNGSIQLLIDPEPNLPDPDSIVKVDYKAFSFFKAVKTGDHLARLIPPEPGTEGKDVYGTPVIPTPGIPLKISLGKNTEFQHEDTNLIIAKSDGKLNVDNGVPFISESLKIKEDVSFRTGNLNFPGSVEIEGNVCDQFSVEAKGDIGIGGVVEKGRVVSDGAIVIKGGVLGDGKSIIKSKLSSVTIGYIRNQRIESHSNIIVYNEVLNGQLLARKSVLMKSSSHSVIGGFMLAYDNIEVFNSGNEVGTKTILEVGKDFETEQALEEQQALLKSTRADLEFMEKIREQLAAIVKWDEGKNPENRLLEQRVKGVCTYLVRVRQELISKINLLDAIVYNHKECHILVMGTAYPGTVLKYKGKVIPITEACKNKKWTFKPN